jgi:hypothetical protein
MTRGRVAASIFLLLAGLVGLGLGTRAITADVSPTCPDLGVECPEVLPAESLALTEEHADAGWTLEPPGDWQPAVTSDEALDTGWGDAAFVEPTAVTPILSILPAGGSVEAPTLVWMLRYEGACVPLRGPAVNEERPACAGQEWNVLINATGGDFIAAFSDR